MWEQLGSKINKALVSMSKILQLLFGKQTIKPNLQSFKNIIKTQMEKKATNKLYHYYRDLLLLGITYGTYKYIHSRMQAQMMLRWKNMNPIIP
jgi:hypothetical protein